MNETNNTGHPKRWREIPGGAVLEETPETHVSEEHIGVCSTKFLGPLKHIKTGAVWTGVNIRLLEEIV